VNKLKTQPVGQPCAPERSGGGADSLPPDWREWFHERAAIREFDGGLPRAEAERAALAETMAAMRAITTRKKDVDVNNPGMKADSTP